MAQANKYQGSLESAWAVSLRPSKLHIADYILLAGGLCALLLLFLIRMISPLHEQLSLIVQVATVDQIGTTCFGVLALLSYVRASYTKVVVKRQLMYIQAVWCSLCKILFLGSYLDAFIIPYNWNGRRSGACEMLVASGCLRHGTPVNVATLLFLVAEPWITFRVVECSNMLISGASRGHSSMQSWRLRWWVMAAGPLWVLPRLLLRFVPSPAIFWLVTVWLILWHLSFAYVTVTCRSFVAFAPTTLVGMVLLLNLVLRLVADLVELSFSSGAVPAVRLPMLEAFMLFLLLANSVYHHVLSAYAATVGGENALLKSEMDGVKMQLDATRKEVSERTASAAARQRFMRYVFHEVRVPFNSIVLGLEVLTDEEVQRLSADGQVVLDMLTKAAFAAQTVLNDVLDFSKIENGAFQIAPVPCSVAELIDMTLLSMLAMARDPDTKVQLCTSIDPHLPPLLLADKVRLQQVVANLVSNAIKFAPHDGTGRVQLDVRILQDSWLHLDTAAPGRLFVDLSATQGQAEELISLLRHTTWRARSAGESGDEAHAYATVEECPEAGAGLVVTGPDGVPAPALQAGSSNVGAGPQQSSCMHMSQPTVTGGSEASLSSSASLLGAHAQSAAGVGSTRGPTLPSCTCEGKTFAPECVMWLPHTTDIAPDPRTLEQLRAHESAVQVVDACQSTDCKGGHGRPGTLPYRTLLISVQDNGAGIPPDELGLLFSAFRQLDAGLQYKGKGTGLGLAICHEIIGLHGGRMGVSSTGIKGQGATFTILLRLPVLQQSKPSHTGSSVGTVLSGPTLLRHGIRVSPLVNFAALHSSDAATSADSITLAGDVPHQNLDAADSPVPASHEHASLLRVSQPHDVAIEIAPSRLPCISVTVGDVSAHSEPDGREPSNDSQLSAKEGLASFSAPPPQTVPKPSHEETSALHPADSTLNKNSRQDKLAPSNRVLRSSTTTFPALRSSSDSADPSSGVLCRPLRILCVDDMADNRRLLVRSLRNKLKELGTNRPGSTVSRSLYSGESVSSVHSSSSPADVTAVSAAGIGLNQHRLEKLVSPVTKERLSAVPAEFDQAEDGHIAVAKVLGVPHVLVERACVGTCSSGRVQLEMDMLPNRGILATERLAVYDVITMDAEMPTLSGFSATRALRAAGYRGLILGATGNGLQQDRDLLLESGCDEVFVKPLSVAAVADAIIKALH